MSEGDDEEPPDEVIANGGVPNEAVVCDEKAEYEPWNVLYRDEPWPGQAERRAELGARPGYSIHDTAFIAQGAHIVADSLVIGEWSQIAADCVIRGEVTIGAHCSLNAGAATQGLVTVGEGVRIAAGASLIGANHIFDDLDTPIWLQGETKEGIVVEDDVWIGLNVVVVDGVTIGAHSVVAAGAVVTKDVAPYSVMAGVPARLVRSRRSGPAVRDRLSAFDDVAAEQWPAVLERCLIEMDGNTSFVDTPGAAWGPRPMNDAIEIAAAFDAFPDGFDRDELVDRLRAQQDPTSGRFFGRVDQTVVDGPLSVDYDDEWAMYGFLSTGYALEVLGSGPAHPVKVVEDCTPEELVALLDSLDQEYLAWPSGSWVDGYATAVYLNRRHHGSTDDGGPLWSWLAEHQHPESGMWGRWLPVAGELDFRWLMAVNGFYRLTRGTYAQFGVPVPHPEAVIDTVLAHGRDRDWFHTRDWTACNVLDVVHPLWLVSQQTDHRNAEIRDRVASLAGRIPDHWIDGAGFAFSTEGEPGLQGTEMWLSILYLAADLLNESAGLSWSPKGVHRLHPADRIDLPAEEC